MKWKFSLFLTALIAVLFQSVAAQGAPRQTYQVFFPAIYKEFMVPTNFSSGPIFPGTSADDAAVGSIPWNNTVNIKAEDGFIANNPAALLEPTVYSHYLKGTNFGFTIPAHAVIVGLKLEVKNQSSAGHVIDNVVKLVRGGAVVGSNYASATTWPSAGQTWRTYGGSSDLWGTTWTPDQVNAADFGAVVQAHTDSGNDVGGVDAFRITVYYTLSSDATLSNLTISSGTLTPAFAPATISYSDDVQHGIASVTVTPTANDSYYSALTVNGTPVASGSPSGNISLNRGNNTITIVVTAEDGTTTKTYTITVYRPTPPAQGIVMMP